MGQQEVLTVHEFSVMSALLNSAALLRQVRLCFAGTGREIINSDQRETTRRTILTKNYVMSRKIIEFIDC